MAAATVPISPADAKMVAGSIYELYTADDIYSISGELLAAADTLLGTATTDQNGLAYFDVDVPLRGEHYGSSDAHDWTTNSGRYYLPRDQCAGRLLMSRA